EPQSARIGRVRGRERANGQNIPGEPPTDAYVGQLFIGNHGRRGINSKHQFRRGELARRGGTQVGNVELHARAVQRVHVRVDRRRGKTAAKLYRGGDNARRKKQIG